MRIKDMGNSVAIWLSSRDTEQWASKPGAAWPCSTLAGHRIFAAFDSNGLYELSIDGKDGDCDSTELSAICADHLATRIKPNHPVYFVAIGQFLASA